VHKQGETSPGGSPPVAPVAYPLLSKMFHVLYMLSHTRAQAHAPTPHRVC
jgi:hypothetical protein